MTKLIEFHIAGVKKHRPALGIKIIIKFCLYERHLCLEQKIISFVVCYRTLSLSQGRIRSVELRND
jgi:hypothetical protein